MNIYNAVPGEPLPLGHRWENNALRIVFDISAWVDAFGAGTVRLLHQRQGDAAPYPVSVTRTDADGTPNGETGTRVLWDVSNADTAQVCHFGRAELRYYAGREGAEEFLAKSDIWKTEVRDALGGAQADAPEAQREWLDELLAKADGIEANVAAAQAAQELSETAQAQAQAAATRIGNFFFYIDRDPESETYGHLMQVHDVETEYAPETPRVIAQGADWTFDESLTLTISHIGPLNSLPDVGEYKSAIRRVVLESGVASVGNGLFYSFYWRDGLTSAAIAGSVASIGDSAFQDCANLREIEIQEGVRSIGFQAFRDCSSLESVTIPDSVASIGTQSFYGCSSLSDVIIGRGVKNIPLNAFRDCASLTSVAIPNSVTNIGTQVFLNCSSLTNITIPDSVINIGESAFRGCSALASVTIPDSVASIGDSAFQDCASLTSVAIPDRVTSVASNAFYNCSSLTSVAIPSGVSSIGAYAFRGCSALREIAIPETTASFGEGAFQACGLRNVELLSGADIPRRMFYTCGALSAVKIAEGATSIGEESFAYCWSLRSVTIPASLTSVGQNAFQECEDLTDVYYAGTPEQKSAISVHYSGNSKLKYATWHYNWEG